MNRYLFAGLLVTVLALVAFTLAPIGIFPLAPTAQTPAEGSSIVFEGYNFNTWGMASITLRNLGISPVTIEDVYFDGQELALGLVGVPTTHGNYMRTIDGNLRIIETLDMIFPERNHYNLANYASSTSTVPPGGFLIIYINVDAPPEGTEHELKVITGKIAFVINVVAGETATFSQSYGSKT